MISFRTGAGERVLAAVELKPPAHRSLIELEEGLWSAANAYLIATKFGRRNKGQMQSALQDRAKAAALAVQLRDLLASLDVRVQLTLQTVCLLDGDNGPGLLTQVAETVTRPGPAWSVGDGEGARRAGMELRSRRAKEHMGVRLVMLFEHHFDVKATVNYPALAWRQLDTLKPDGEAASDFVDAADDSDLIVYVTDTGLRQERDWDELRAPKPVQQPPTGAVIDFVRAAMSEVLFAVGQQDEKVDAPGSIANLVREIRKSDT